MSIHYNDTSDYDIICCSECGNTRHSIISIIRDTKQRNFKIYQGNDETIWGSEHYMIEIQTCKCTECEHEWEVEIELNPEKTVRHKFTHGAIVYTS